MLTCVPTQMGSQVRCFAVDFIASGYVADVLALTVGMAFAFGAVGAGACDAFQTWLYIHAVVDVDVHVDRRLALGHCGVCGACGLGRCWLLCWS